MPAVRVELLIEQPIAACDAPQMPHVVVRLQAARVEGVDRPAVDLVACVDVSGSMAGRKLEEARRSVTTLIRELDGRDRLGITAFSSEAERVAPLRTMDTAGRADHVERTTRLRTHGNTNMSGGLVLSLGQLASSPRPEGSPRALERVLLFTDGHANAGVPEGDHAAWTALLQEQLRGRTVSWLGFGEDHDARFLSWLADQTGGNAYVARDASAISAAFAQELGGLLGTAAQQVQLKLRSPLGPVRMLNEERAQVDGDTLVVSVDDLSSEEQKDLVLQLPRVVGLRDTVRRVLEVDVSWVETRSGRAESLTTSAEIRFVEAHQVPPVGDAVREAIVLQRAATAVREATALADREQYERAAELLRRMAEEVVDVATERAKALARLLLQLADEFADGRVYTSSSSRHASIRRSLSKQKSSGSDADGLYETEVQRAMRSKFAATEFAPEEPAAPTPSPAPPAPRTPRKKRP